MFEFINKCVNSIDLAGLSTNPKERGALKGKAVFKVLLDKKGSFGKHGKESSSTHIHRCVFESSQGRII
jgi:hypothetical protein